MFNFCIKSAITNVPSVYKLTLEAKAMIGDDFTHSGGVF